MLCIEAWNTLDHIKWAAHEDLAPLFKIGKDLVAKDMLEASVLLRAHRPNDLRSTACLWRLGDLTVIDPFT